MILKCVCAQTVPLLAFSACVHGCGTVCALRMQFICWFVSKILAPRYRISLVSRFFSSSVSTMYLFTEVVQWENEFIAGKRHNTTIYPYWFVAFHRSDELNFLRLFVWFSFCLLFFIFFPLLIFVFKLMLFTSYVQLAKKWPSKVSIPKPRQEKNCFVIFFLHRFARVTTLFGFTSRYWAEIAKRRQSHTTAGKKIGL